MTSDLTDGDYGKIVPMAQVGGVLLALLLSLAAPAKADSFSDWLENLRTSGIESQWPAILSEPLGLGLSGDAPTRYFELFPRDVLDDSGHGATLLFKDGKPAWLLLSKRWQDNRSGRGRTHMFRAALDGTLERVVLQQDKVDASGEAIEGSAQDKILDVKSPAVRAAYQRELDLWLKGKYRKKAKKSKSASAAPVQLPVASAITVTPAR